MARSRNGKKPSLNPESRILNPYHGFINLHKPLGITSTDAVNKAKWLIKPTKIGHAGTLDPLATGVLPLALGEGTKCINLLMDAKKTYEFSVTFGERRATDDAEGEVVATSDKIPSEAEIRAILPRFTGVIAQTPPIYSALKVDGKRAYDLARAGEEVELKAREVTVYVLEFLEMEQKVGVMDIHHLPSPLATLDPLPQGERASAWHSLDSSLSACSTLTGLFRPTRQEALSPCGRGVGDGAWRVSCPLEAPSPLRLNSLRSLSLVASPARGEADACRASKSCATWPLVTISR